MRRADREVTDVDGMIEVDLITVKKCVILQWMGEEMAMHCGYEFGYKAMRMVSW